MRLLADENIDRPIVDWLRAESHDVVEVLAVAPGATDESVVGLSRSDGRVLMTFDRDIGRIVLLQQEPHPGVVYLRLRAKGPELWEMFKRLWPAIELAAPGRLCTVGSARIRQRPLPSRRP